MRSTWTSSTSPLLHRVNSSSFPQPDLPPVSPPASVNGEETLPQPGCGWEFEIVPEEHMRQKEHEVAARFQRYGRFGMRLEEARLPTPEHYRTAYDELVEAITPSPSPESVADSTRDSRKVIETGRNLKRKGTTNADADGHSGTTGIPSTYIYILPALFYIETSPQSLASGWKPSDYHLERRISPSVWCRL
ncbi:hypothetical protein DL95DRAFT_464045 [Leptodontidium sp. 2 PMI_412]|nr:hypothetical protein DL95DRAFT_464045 [Leptodontidium sp. 2 PMI_412]